MLLHVALNLKWFMIIKVIIILKKKMKEHIYDIIFKTIRNALN